MTKLRALVNMSHGKMLLIGDTFEENSKKNVDFFVKKKFAEVVEEEIETEEVPEDEKTEEEPIEDAEDFEDDFDDVDPFDETEIDKARSHDQLDEIQKELGFDLPGRDKLNLDQRKAKIKAELSGDAK